MQAKRYGFLLLLALLLTTVWGHTAHAQAGTMRYNTATKKYEFHDGTRWYYVGGTLSLLILSYKYCDGSYWHRIVGTATLELCSQPGVIDYRPAQNTYLFCNGLLWTRMKGGQSPAA
jgi:hypothetical protein